jgi:hypothetical protein
MLAVMSTAAIVGLGIVLVILAVTFFAVLGKARRSS